MKSKRVESYIKYSLYAYCVLINYVLGYNYYFSLLVT